MDNWFIQNLAQPNTTSPVDKKMALAAHSVSEGAREIQRAYNQTLTHHSVSEDDPDKFLEQVTVMQGSIWEYSDSQPWFLLGLHKNNPAATRQALESLMKFQPVNNDEDESKDKRRGTVTLKDGAEKQSLCNSQGHKVSRSSTEVVKHGVGSRKQLLTVSAAEELYTTYMAKFSNNMEMKIVIKKTVELVSDMSKSCELVYHAVRACARFLTYPTPSVPSNNFAFGHVKGWIWLIHKGLSHFNHDKTNRQDLDLSLKRFRKEMSALAKEANKCVTELSGYVNDLRKLNVTIRKEAKIMKKHKKIWAAQMDRYFHYADELKAKRHLLIDVHEDRFFPTDWMFEPHPSQTKLEWDFFHFQWVNLKRNWIDCEFELRSDYSLHWSKYSSFPPNDQTDIIVHLIQHLKALIEECHNFHKLNMHLSFDSQEVKFLKFAVEEIVKLKRYHEAVKFITTITKKLFEDLEFLEKIIGEYLSHFEWIVTIIEPCYQTMNSWLADDLILPLEFSARIRRRRRWSFQCNCFRREKTFLEMFGEPLEVVLLRTPISMSQVEKYFPTDTRLPQELMPSAAINAYGTSGGYCSSIFDAGLGRERPLPIHHPLPKYKKRQEQKFNIFDIHRLIESSVDCLIKRKGTDCDVDTEKYLNMMEEVQRFFAVFSTIFSFMMVDLKERVEILESLMYSNLPEHYGSLEKIIVYECSTHTDSLEKSGIRAFGRLLKVFQFVVYFLEKVNDLGDNECTYYAAKAAYYKSYGKLQSWIYQKAATFSMYSLPSKHDMLSSLFADNDNQEMGKNIQEFVETGYKLIEICENIARNNNIAPLFCYLTSLCVSFASHKLILCNSECIYY